MLDGWILVCVYDLTHGEPALCVDLTIIHTLDNALVQFMNRLWHAEIPPAPGYPPALVLLAPNLPARSQTGGFFA